jgi:RND family efflux transporter MFP subunit
MMPISRQQIRRHAATVVLLVSAGVPVACARTPDSSATQSVPPARTAGTPITVRDTVVATTFDAGGIADPIQQAALSTRLMGVVTAVRVHEGEKVAAGQLLLEIDARDLTAKANQVAATIADAEAVRRESETHAARFRALYADSAATKAQFDAAETGLARADAGLRAAKAGAVELEALRSYAQLRAPFSGVISMRMADPGAFAVPGAPLMAVQDVSSLRIKVRAPANAAVKLIAGRTVQATIDGQSVSAVIEGVVPTGTGNLYTINAIVPNRQGAFRAGSAATLSLPLETRRGIYIPTNALIREGDLVGVIQRGSNGDDRRWIRIGQVTGAYTEVTAGLVAGDTIVVPRDATPTSQNPGA